MIFFHPESRIDPTKQKEEERKLKVKSLQFTIAFIAVNFAKLKSIKFLNSYKKFVVN
jgi:hypothetical protein